MKKYFLKESRQEIAVGQTIELTTPVTSSYGEGVAVTKVKVTESVLKKLIRDGFVVEEDPEEEQIKQAIVNLRPYIKKLAKKMGISYNSAYMFLSMLSEHPLTHLTMLIEAMSNSMNEGKALDSSYYILHPLYGFTPYKVTIKGTSKNLTPGLFYNKADADAAYHILKPFIARLGGE